MSEDQITVGNYELHNCISSGNSTQIWEVSDPSSPMQLAMKLLLEEALKKSAEKSLLKYEYKIGSAMDHPGFVRFHQIEVNRDHGFFTMEFISSPSLKTHLTSGLPAIQSAFGKMSGDLCRAFHYMHEQGWLHRDIKPDNIMVTKSGEAKVIDFSLTTRLKTGIGKMFSKQKVIQGTRNYIAPETILKQPLDQRTDLYSLGVAFYEVVTGVLPFAGDSPAALLKKHVGEKPPAPSAINPNVTPELDEVLMKMLAKKPADRFQNMQEAGAALRGMKYFTEDPLSLHEKMMREQKEEQTQSVDKRLDSRADAARTAAGIKAPVKKKNKPKPTAAMLKEEERRKQREAEKSGQQQPAEAAPAAAAAAAPAAYPGMPGQPVPGMMPGQMMPGQAMPGMMPGQMMPGQAMPGMMPGQMMPGQPTPGMMPGQMMPGQMMPGQAMPGMMPGQMPPGQPMPGMPMPGQMMPGQPVPGQPVPGQAMPGQPVPGMAPAQAVPPQPGAPVQQPAAAQPKAAADATEDDLKDMMDMIE